MNDFHNLNLLREGVRGAQDGRYVTHQSGFRVAGGGGTSSLGPGVDHSDHAFVGVGHAERDWHPDFQVVDAALLLVEIHLDVLGQGNGRHLEFGPLKGDTDGDVHVLGDVDLG